jgi:two-component system, chemotaxis family, CheB/CheR fusion protein
MDLTKQIHDYEVRISALRSRQSSQRTPLGLFDELYEEVSQGIEELRIVDEELRQRNTELYEAYSALLQERQRYHELFAFAPDAYLVTDLNGVMLEANAHAERLFELPAEYLRGKSFGQFAAGRRQREVFKIWFSTFLDAEGKTDIEIVLRAQRRGRFPAEVRVARLAGPSRDFAHLLWVIRDVSRTRRARRDAELAAVVRACGDAILTQTMDGIVSTYNPAARLLYGLRPREVIGHPFLRLIAPERRCEHERLIASLSRALPVQTIDTLHVRGDGTQVNVSVTASLILQESAVPRGVAFVVHEITERKLLEARLRDQALELERSDQRKTDFIAVLAHELRSPLNVVVSALHAFAESPDDALRREIPAMCLRNARYMTRLIGELLDLSRISRDELAVFPRSITVQQVVTRAIELSRPTFEARRHAFDVEISEQPLTIDADPARMIQAITNLLDNSAKYTAPGGRIRLIARDDESGAVISVEDNGVGIPSELIGRVFEPFVQGDPAHHRARSGLGLGLALVKRIIELHGGSVTAESEGLNRGSVFTIRLPRGGALIADAFEHLSSPDNELVD